MTRVTLSSNLTIDKIVLSIITLIVVALWIALPFLPIIIFLLAFIFIANSLYTFLWYTSKVSYTNSHLFIGSRVEKNVPFEKITLIAVTPHYGTLRTMWKINYVSENKERSVYFYPQIGVLTMDEFIVTVKQRNPKVEVRSYTLTLDIDL